MAILETHDIDKCSHSETARALVSTRYHDLLKDQMSEDDKIFISGSELKHLDLNLVTLDDDLAEHPRRWCMKKKIRLSVIVGMFCFLSPFASTVFAPALHFIMADLGITDSTLGALQVSIFIFAFAIAPLFLAPLSELYGRAIVIQAGNLIFVAFSIGGGFAQTPAQLAVCRFIAGMGGSSGIAAVGGVVTDIWDASQRPKASGLIMIGPVLGPIFGPVCGGWMSERASWRWTCWVPAIAGGVLVIAGMLMDESFGPAILRRKLKKEQKKRPQYELYTVLDLDRSAAQQNTIGSMFSSSVRPVVYLLLDPALFLASLYNAITFGIVYFVIVTYPDVFGLGYGHSLGIIGTDYLAFGVGMIIGEILTIKGMEVIYGKQGSADGSKKHKPESRLLSAVPGALVTAGGLFMYGFSALRTSFIVPLIGVAIFSIGIMNIMFTIQLYAIEGFRFPASAFAGISVLRFIFAGAFPLFGSKLFVALGIDWGLALLAFIIIGFGIPFIPMLYFFGPRLREIGMRNMSKFEGTVAAEPN